MLFSFQLSHFIPWICYLVRLYYLISLINEGEQRSKIDLKNVKLKKSKPGDYEAIIDLYFSWVVVPLDL